MPARIRADQLIYEQGLAESVAVAASLVMAGRIALVSERKEPLKVAKAGQLFSPDVRFQLLPGKQWASRGGEKLQTILNAFPLDLTGAVCVDAGASTGGFTDCLLAHGAKRVYAIDVGKNLLHEKLRNDTRVINLERVNLRCAPADLLPEKADFLAADLSFISLTRCVPSFLPWLSPGSHMALLVKPQFELDASETVKGVVREDALRQKALRKVETFCVNGCGLLLLRTVPSSIRGAKGNQEYLQLYRMPA